MMDKIEVIEGTAIRLCDKIFDLTCISHIDDYISAYISNEAPSLKLLVYLKFNETPLAIYHFIKLPDGVKLNGDIIKEEKEKFREECVNPLIDMWIKSKHFKTINTLSLDGSPYTDIKYINVMFDKSVTAKVKHSGETIVIYRSHKIIIIDCKIVMACMGFDDKFVEIDLEPEFIMNNLHTASHDSALFEISAI